MKRILLTAILCGVVLVGTSESRAQQHGGFVDPSATAGVADSESGGFVGPGPDVTPAGEVLGMRDDAQVALRGYITRHLGKDKYLFQDDTGTVRVEIDRDKWKGQVITPNDLVDMQGEVDKDWNSVEVEVYSISKAR